MFWIELHSDNTANIQQGSLCLRTQQLEVESYLRIMTGQSGQDEWRRAYAMEYGRVQSVYYRSSTEELHCIGFVGSYHNNWLPLQVYDGLNIITGVWGPAGTSFEEAKQWAQRAFGAETSTVVVLRDGRIYAAFERVQGEIRLVASCPSAER
jgi:hypothetical protein